LYKNIEPTATDTPTNTPTDTPTDTPTNTPTDTPTNTPTDTPTDTPTNTPTDTPTNTPTDTPTDTPTNTPTDTPTNTPTDTPTDTPTNTPTDTPTNTPTDTPTDTPTNTPTNTPTDTPTNTSTGTPIDTSTDTPTDTPTETPTDTPTNTSTDTPTDTPTNTQTDTPTNTPTNTPPNFALRFDGVDDYVNIPHQKELNLGATFTIEAWVQLTAIPTENIAMIIGKIKDHIFDNIPYTLSITPDAKLQFTIENEVNVNQDFESTQSIPIGECTHVAVSRSIDGTLRIFINGSKDVEFKDAVIPANSNTQPVVIGAYVSQYLNTKNFDGLIDEIRLWNNDRTQEEIQQRMYHHLNGTEQGLISYWNFNEGSGQVAHDLTNPSGDGRLGNNEEPDPADPIWMASCVSLGEQPTTTSTPTLTPTPSSCLPGDENRDGTISAMELSRAISYFRMILSPPHDCVDTDGDGVVSAMELSRVISAFRGTL